MKLRSIIVKSAATIAIALVAFVGFMTNLNTEDTNRSNIPVSNTSAYKTGLSEIKESSWENNASTISIHDFYNVDKDDMFSSIKTTNLPVVNENSIITIENGRELHAFSQLCKEDARFLGYNYELYSNIDFTEATRYLGSFYPVGTIDNKFSGSFNGNGYEITSLKLYSYSNDETIEKDSYSSMFAYNAGTLENFGLINTSISQTVKPDKIVGVAPISGLNTGTVKNVYVIDNRNASDASGGIAASGGYSIAGFVYENQGTIEDCYTSYSILVSYSVQDYFDFREISNENEKGTIKNVYFHDDCIKSYENGIYVYDEYLVGVSIDEKVNNVYGEYVSSLDNLNSKFNKKTGWYTANTYPSNKMKIKYPNRNGLAMLGNENTLIIKNEFDFVKMFDLMNTDPYFASKSMTYYLLNDIDLKNIPAYLYSYNDFFSATFTGATEYAGSLTLKNGNKVTTPTIYNATIKNSVAHDGFDCYGVFPLLSGTISNVNFYNTTTINGFAEGTKTLTKSIGIVSGYVEDGTIQNVNVYSNIELSTASSNFGRYIAGMAVGIAGRFSNISKLTTAGSINGAIHNYNSTIFANAASGYEQGNSLGGVIGYSLQTNRRMSNLLSGTNLIATAYNIEVSINQMLGGIVGSGYATSFVELTNKGNITIGSDSNANNGIVSAAGIIGRLYGVNDEIRSIHSQGTISLTVNAVKETFISGVANVDLQISVNGKTLLKSISTEFSASGVTNSTIISVTNNISNNTAPSINLAGMFYINSSNKFTSNLRNIYNLNYQYNDSNDPVSNEKITSEIDIASIKEFAPIFVSTATGSEGKISAQSCYNLRDYNYITSKSSYFTTGKYSGCISGSYVSLEDCRNEGNLNFEITNGSSYTDLYIYGIFETLSDKCYAKILYNGGNINIDYNNINLASSSKIYVSGICINNNSQIKLDTQNPLNSNFDNSLAGSIDNVINKGNILITSEEMDKRLSTNNPVNNNLTLTSSIYASGITYSNSGIISNSFNLGDIIIESFSKRSGTEYEIGGIACKSTEQYAQIRDSANNGTLKAVNMSNISATMNVGGIVATNVGNSKNINEIIAFTINYGTVICFNGTSSMKSPTYDNAHAMASGIIASGICNAVNVVNYGTIYSSEVAGSLIGRVKLSSFDNVNVSLANTINYGKVYALEKHHFDQATIYYPTHSEVDELKYYTYGEYSESRNVYQYCGSMVGLIDFNSRNNFNIRYLINFFNGSNISGYELSAPSTAVDTATFITTNGSTDTFGKGSVKYAPLSTISDELGNIGVFSQDFVFRKAIDGIGIDNNIVTDSYIADFFQFIRFDKINEKLLDSIGWRTLAYVNASEVFARNILNVKVLIEKTGSVVNSDGILADEFTDGTWIESVDLSLLEDFIEESLKTNELSDDLKSILTYIFFEQTNTSLISNTLRQNVINAIINYYDENNSDYYTILQTLLYDELLAKVVAEDNSNYSSILQKIDEILSSATDLRDVLVNYVSVLENDISLLDPLYNEQLGDYYINKKMDVIEKLISGLSDDVVERMLSVISSSGADSLKYSTYLKEHPADAKAIFTLLVQYNNIENEVYREAINKSLKKYETTEIIETTDSFTLNYDNYDENNGNTYINGESIAFSKDYTELWNIIKDDSELQEYISTNYFNNVTDPTSSIIYRGLIAKATEYNNTYQSQDAPSDTTKGINNSEGVTRAENAGSQIKNRFVYTPDSVANEGTYYYGPFMANGEVFGDKIGINRNTYLGRDIYNAALITDTNKSYVPIFISTNENITNDKILASNTTATNKNYYPFYWNNFGGGGDPHNQWVSDYILNNAPSDGGRYLYKNYNTGTYIVDYYDFSPDKYYTTNELSSATNTTIVYNGSNVTINLSSSYNQTYSDLNGGGTQNHPLRDYYLKAYCTTSMVTGLWNILDIWYDKGKVVGCYLTSKSGDDISGYKGVQTTQYTYYQMADLIKLDGIRTKGLSDNVVDSDEIAIISSLLTKILSTTDGQKVVLKALSKYASTTDFSSSQNASASLLLSALKGTTFAQNSVQSVFSVLSDSKLNSLYTYKDNSLSKTLKQHLDELISTIDYTPKQNLAMIASTDKEVFRDILLMLLKPLSNENGTNETNSSDLAYFVYEYSKYLKSQGKTEAEILDLINSIKESDITAFEKLSELDFGYVLGVQDIADMSGTDYIFYKFEVMHTGVISVNGIESSDHGANQGTSSWIIPANTPINISGNGVVIDCELYGVNSITTGTSSPYYVLELTFKNGNITINGNRQLAADDKITAQWVLECNKTYDITTTSKPVISDVKMYAKNVINLEGDTGVIVKFSGTVTINGESKKNTVLQETKWDIPSGSYEVEIVDGTEIEYLYYPISYDLPQVTYRMGNAFGTGTDVSFESGEEQTLPVSGAQTYSRGNAVYTYGTLSFTNVPAGSKIKLELSSGKFNITTTTKFSDGVTGSTATINSYSGESWLFRSSAGGVRTLSQIKITYTLTYGSDTITYTQYLFSSNTETPSISGTVTNISSYAINGGEMVTVESTTLNISNLNKGNNTGIFYCVNGTKVNPADLNVSTAQVEANMYKKVDISSMTQVADLSTIEENYNTYYPNLSQYGNYIASNLINVTSGNTITIEEPSIVFVHATGSGSITLDNYTRTTTADSHYYAFYISVPGTYTIASSSTVIDEVLIVNIDSGLSVSEDLTSIIYNDGSKDETVFKGINYNYLKSFMFTNLITDSTIKDLVLLLFPTMKNNENEYSIFENAAFTSDNLKELIKLFANADYSDKTNSVFAKLLNGYNGNVSDILLSIDNDELKRIIAERIFSISNADKANYSDVYSLAVATYIGNDYLTYANLNQLTKTKIYKILDLYDPQGDNPQGYYEYITSDTTIDSDLFLELMVHLELTANIDGYGIYAMSSSAGILNGQFVPDNINLSIYDPYYKKNHNGQYILSDEKSDSWRGGTSTVDGVSMPNTPDGSVNKAFYVEMKQLKKSIATSIFKLELISTDESNTIITTPSSEIDLKNKTVDFYLPKNGDGTNLTYKINTTAGSYELSYAATFFNDGDSLNKYDSNTLTVTEGSPNAETTITVYAEDRDVYAKYTVSLHLTREIALDLTSVEVNGETSVTVGDPTVDGNTKLWDATGEYVNAVGGRLTLSFNTTNLPDGFNLDPYITIDGKTNYHEPITSSIVVNNNKFTNGVWGSGTALVDLLISNSLSKGDHTLQIQLGSKINYQVKFKKAAATGTTISNVTMVDYTGEIVNVTFTTDKVANTLIKYGKGYTLEDFTLDENGIPKYLSSFTVSDNANVNISASYDVNANGLMVYTVIYTITPEEGSKVQYKHILTERDPFLDAKVDDKFVAGSISKYVSVIRDGAVMNVNTDSGFTLDSEGSGALSMGYAREDKDGNQLTPRYRFNYKFDGFEYLDDISTYLSVKETEGQKTDSNGNDLYTIDLRYYGMLIMFNAEALPIDYTFNLVYEKEVNWTGEIKYTRSYTFPEIKISKTKSSYAFLDRIRFIVGLANISDLATATSLNEIKVDNYDTLKNGKDNNTGKDFVASESILYYNTDAARRATDYYIVGALSGEELSSYAPKFTIKSYSKIYQYITVKDKNYVYISLINSETKEEELFLRGQNDNNIYNKDIITSTSTISPIGTLEDNKITIGSVSYTVSEYFGTDDSRNKSLVMDYIGNPEEGCFWYVNYMVVAEDGVTIKNYHVAVIDLTNNIKFNFEIIDSTGTLNSNSLYVSVVGYTAYYGKKTGQTSSSYYLFDENDEYTPDDNKISDDSKMVINKAISGWVTKQDDGSYKFIDEHYNVESYGIQAMPYSYFYFYIDLPDGYAVTYQIEAERYDSNIQWGDNSFLPKQTIVTQKVSVKMTIVKSDAAKFPWGQKVLAVLNQKATFDSVLTEEK